MSFTKLRGWMAGIGGCPNVGGICIGCTMPGFPDKFMPFMDEPPGARVSSLTSQIFGRAVHQLRRITNHTLNKEPAKWLHALAPNSPAASEASYARR